MIYINRATVPVPEMIRKQEVRETFERQRNFFTDPANAADIERGKFDPERFSVPMDEELPGKLVQLFHNKCAFCESLLNTGDEYLLPLHTEERKRYGQSMKQGLSQVKSDEVKKAMNRGLRSVKGKQEHIPGVAEWTIGLFRPEYRAMDTDGTISNQHYWWLGWDWENMYLLCRSCRNSKENRFPVVNKVRAAYQNQGLESLRQGLEEEQPLLLDPCRPEDFRERHIFFKDGKAIHSTEKGKMTISFFSLNRPGLPEIRKMVVENFIEAYREKKNDGASTRDLLQPHHPFAAAILDYLWLENGQGDEAQDICREVYAGELPAFYGSDGDTGPSGKNAFADEAIREREKALREESEYDLENKKNLEAYYNQAIWIERVVIQNFKVFSNLEVEFPSTSSDSRPWLALLGENGVGKSSISQAIALTLMGKNKLAALDLEADDYIRRGTAQAKVEVYLLNRKDPITLIIDREGEKGSFKVSPEKPQMVLMGYGATRLLGDSTDAGEDPPYFIRPKNLFSPLARLGNGLQWLSNPDDVDDALFDQITGRLRDLLQLDQHQSVIREKPEGEKTYELFLLETREDGTKSKTPFKFLSSGYQTILAMALDIMIGASDLLTASSDDNVDKGRHKSLLDIDGLALIDEIGVHLHPRWKMRIVKALKKTFPKLSFIITTHEPLCLRGLVEGEVVLLQKDEQNEVTIITDLPSPQTLTIQQLLTSTFFGLSSIIDPDLEADYDRYYSLLARIDTTEDEQEKQAMKNELEQLQQKLEDKKIELGNTYLEKIEYQQLIPGKVAIAKKKKNIIGKVDREEVEKILKVWDKALED